MNADRQGSGAAALVALAALALALVPVLGTPRVSDDVINYSFRWLSPGEFAQATLAEIRHWAMSSGRVYVFATILKNTVFQFFETALAYKAFLVALNVAAAAAFFAYVRSVGASRRTGVVAILLLPVLLQLRDFHDPVVSFNGLFQVSALLTFASLALHVRYLATRRPARLWACLAAFVANLFFYELAAITIVLVWVQDRLLDAGPGKRYRATLLLAGAFAIYAAMMVASRLVGHFLLGWGPSTYGLNFSPGPVAVTFAKQVVAVVPFSYILFGPRNGAWGVHAFPESTPWLGSWQFFLALPLFLALAWLALRAAGAAHAARREATATLAWISALLIVLPAAIIAVVARYQGGFGFGNGYSFVYLQGFGAALGIALLFESLVARVPEGGRALPGAAFCAVAALLCAGNLVNNVAVAGKLSQAWSAQYAWAAAVNSPDMKAACSGAPIYVVDPKPWTEYRILRHAGHASAAKADLDRHRQQKEGAASDICVSRGVTLLGRRAVAYARARVAPGVAALAPAAGLNVVIPLASGEHRPILQMGSACLPSPGRLALVGEWEFAGARYGSYAADAAQSGLRWHEAGFSLPCE